MFLARVNGSVVSTQKVASNFSAADQDMSSFHTRPAIPSVWMKRALLIRPAKKIEGTLVWIRLRGMRSTRKPHMAAASGKPTM